jgi:hypothetical protein
MLRLNHQVLWSHCTISFLDPESSDGGTDNEPEQD